VSGRLAGRVALVTGGSTGIGAAVVERFVSEGAAVVACARHEPGQPFAGDVTFVTADVTSADDMARAVAAANDQHGRLDIVVANAGTGGGGQWPTETADEWQAIIDLNLNGTMLTCRAAWPHLVEASGSVVIVSSLSAVMGVGRTELEQMGGFQPSPSRTACSGPTTNGSSCSSATVARRTSPPRSPSSPPMTPRSSRAPSSMSTAAPSPSSDRP